ncbi:ficolin-1-A-like [Ixodes scapularis]|uniref:ficolin-1-A-like n=1 Tax=Ixodes scapularis TaxID=6945 RepID=UPI001A9D90FD|nr:ficolin-1-A-like [Ixodes scapularis]
MFAWALFIPLVAGSIFLESSFHRVPEITERSGFTKTYGIFDPCNLNKPGNRIVSCAQLRRQGNNISGYYWINPHNEFYVKCDMDTDGGGWTVIQRRSWAEPEDYGFERSKEEYEKGFAGSASSYWIGNENIHALTSHPSSQQVLRIELTKENDETIVANYGKFEVGPKSDGYRLTYAKYWSPNGTQYDGLGFHNQTRFYVVKEKDRVDPCSQSPISGGWWIPFSGCLFSNLNGRKLKNKVPKNTRGLAITWYKIGDESSFDIVYKSVEMKVRDVDYNFCTGKLATLFSYS